MEFVVKNRIHVRRLSSVVLLLQMLLGRLPESVGIPENPFFPLLSNVPTSWNTSPEHEGSYSYLITLRTRGTGTWKLLLSLSSCLLLCGQQSF